MSAALTLLAVMLIAAPLTYILQAELNRLDQTRRRREWLRTHPEVDRIRRGFVQLQIQIRDEMTPVLQDAAQKIAALGKVVR